MSFWGTIVWAYLKDLEEPRWRKRLILDGSGRKVIMVKRFIEGPAKTKRVLMVKRFINAYRGL